MNKLYLLLTLCFTLQAQTYGQQSNSSNDSKPKENVDRWQIGGDFALNFGTVTYVNLSPRLGYRINGQLTLGAGVVYNYLKDNRLKGFEFSNYGGLIFANYAIVPEFILVSEYQSLSVERFSEFNNTKFRTPVDVLFIGAAYRLQFGGNSFGYISLLYDVFEDINSPYSNPYLGGGIIFTL
jgi:hypothetical protein